MLPLILRRIYFAFVTLLRSVSVVQTAIFIIQLMLVLYLTFATPFALRYALAANFVRQIVPLEFTFHTCHVDLHGVCSFPEANILVEPDTLHMEPGYKYSFALELLLYDTPQNRELGVFIAGVQPRSEDGRPLAHLHKSVPVLQSNFAGGGRLLYTLVRNVVFLPLYLLGFFADDPAASARQIDVKFPQLYVEKPGNATRFIFIQLQNKFIQIASASLLVEAHVGLLRHLVTEFPLLTYAVVGTASFLFYSSIFLVYWAWRGYGIFEAQQQ